jgi:N6-adenosine-specific RNA methylase IME4
MRKHFPDPGSKLELFARQQREGWVTHGLIDTPK